MDPRSKATAAELAEQQRLALEIYGEAQRAGKALAEMNQAKAHLENSQLNGHPELQTQVGKLLAAIAEIQTGKTGSMGLQEASSGLLAALRVVESGNRTTPQQALDVYRLSSEAARIRTDEWQAIKGGALAKLNQALKKAGLAQSCLDRNSRRS